MSFDGLPVKNSTRKFFNTNPLLVKHGSFYAPYLERNYWLGETFEQDLRDAVGSITGSSDKNLRRCLVLFSTERSSGPNSYETWTQEAETGWLLVIFGAVLGLQPNYSNSRAWTW